MSLFDDRLNEYLGDATDVTDIRAVVRKAYFYDFYGFPTRMWNGKGKLYTSDGNVWLGTIDNDGNNVHQAPRLSDDRDGTAPTYEFKFGYVDEATYDGLKADQALVAGRPLTIYRVLFQNGDGLRPKTPIRFAKQVTMESTKFEEVLVGEGTSLVRRYSASVIAKGGNAGRSNVPGRSYADTQQKRYAASLGVALDRGAEFLPGLANRTYKRP